MLKEDFGCDSILVKEVYQNESKSSLQKIALSLISEKTYNKLKSDKSLQFNIDGLQLGDDYSSFQERLNKYMSMTQTNTDYEQAKYTLIENLNENVIKAWSDCKARQYELLKSGLSMWISNVSNKRIQVIITWNPPPGQSSIDIIESSLRGGTVIGSIPEKLENNVRIELTFDRIAKEDFFFQINAGGLYYDSVEYTSTITTLPVIEEKCIFLDKYSEKCQNINIIYKNKGSSSFWEQFKTMRLHGFSSNENISKNFLVQRVDFENYIKELLIEYGAGSAYATTLGGSIATPFHLYVWSEPPKFNDWFSPLNPDWDYGVTRSPNLHYIAWDRKKNAIHLRQPTKKVFFGICLYDPWADTEITVDIDYVKLIFSNNKVL